MKEVYLKQDKSWHPVVAERKPYPLPGLIGGKTQYLEPYLELDNGLQIHPENHNIKVREKVLYEAKLSPAFVVNLFAAVANRIRQMAGTQT
jgi:hypothetical protein